MRPRAQPLATTVALSTDPPLALSMLGKTRQPGPAGRPLGISSRHGPAASRRFTMRRLSSLRRDDRGMATAEYAVGTVAACGFGGVLYKIITSDQVLSLITSVIRKALTLPF